MMQRLSRQCFCLWALLWGALKEHFPFATRCVPNHATCRFAGKSLGWVALCRASRFTFFRGKALYKRAGEGMGLGGRMTGAPFLAPLRKGWTLRSEARPEGGPKEGL